MPYYAEINSSNEVLRVIAVHTKIWCEYHLGCEWVRTYYNKEGKNYAGVWFTYHPDKDNFSAPQPFPSWTLDDTYTWQPPIPYPSDDKSYTWNEETQSWDEDDLLA